MLWLVRGAWLVLPLLAGPALADALDDRSTPVQVAAAVVLWAGWTAGLVATLVPRAASLTALRLLAPGAVAATVAAVVAGPAGGDDVLALTISAVVLVATMAAATTDAFVDGSSYGDERRFALRTPLPALVGAAVAWLLVVAAPAAAVALAARAWLPGLVLAVLGIVGITLGVPAIHRLSLRWLVLVPAGVVVHDRLALADPVLLRRRNLRGVSPAEQGSDAVDLTLGAGGLAVELTFAEPFDLPVAVGTGRARKLAKVEAAGALVAPVRPGVFLTTAAGRRLPVA